MSKNRYIDTKFWDDNFIINCDPIEKLLFIYTLTNPLTNICGIYEISIKRIAFDTGIDKEMIIKIFDRFEKQNKIKYVNGWVAIKNFIKYQKLNPNIEKGIQEILEEVPEDLKKWVFNDSSKAFQSLSKPSNYINLNINRDINSNINANSDKAFQSLSKDIKENDKNIEKIINIYPSKCPIRKVSTQKSIYNKDKLIKKIKEIGIDKCIEITKLYIDNCIKTKTYIKNFKTFINNFPTLNDFTEIKETPEIKRQQIIKANEHLDKSIINSILKNQGLQGL